MSENSEIRAPVTGCVLCVEILLVAALVLPVLSFCVWAWVLGS